MTPDLSHRLGDALGGRDVDIDERERVTTAAAGVDTWDDLPADVQALVEEIESRPGWLEAETGQAASALWTFDLPGPLPAVDSAEDEGE